MKTLEQKEAELKLRLQKIRSDMSNLKRREETRKKILIGAFYLERIKKNADDEKKLIKALDEYLKKDRDRALFGLSPIEEKDAEKPKIEIKKTEPVKTEEKKTKPGSFEIKEDLKDL